MYEWTRKRGAPKDQEVRRVQAALGINADGLFGPTTESAVTNYQSSVMGQNRNYIDRPMMDRLGFPIHLGIDVSAYQIDTNWTTVASSGVKFMWRKTTEGRSHVNQENGANVGDSIPFIRDAHRAKEHDIVTGFYHFGRPDQQIEKNPEDAAQKEAEHFLKWVIPELCDLPPVLDLEKGKTKDPNYNAKWVVAYCDIIEQALCRRCTIYSASWAYDSYLKGADEIFLEFIRKRPLWLADYDGQPDDETRIWDEYAVHQFTGTGTIPGVKGDCDVNWSAGGAIERLMGCSA